jgi:hypothetical protein
MRILILAILYFLSTSTFLMAQDVSFGLKGGINFSNASRVDIESKSVTSFHIGGVMEALYNDKIAIQPEIVYSAQGFTYSEDSEMRNITLAYINVPIMVKYYLTKGFAIEAGPQIGFLNSAKLKSTRNGENTELDIKDGLRSNDLCFNIGIGLLLDNGLNFNARYCYGITNIANRLTDEKFKNRVVQLSIGYMF